MNIKTKHFFLPGLPRCCQSAPKNRSGLPWCRQSTRSGRSGLPGASITTARNDRSGVNLVFHKLAEWGSNGGSNGGNGGNN